jgi:hypothetical protein
VAGVSPCESEDPAIAFPRQRTAQFLLGSAGLVESGVYDIDAVGNLAETLRDLAVLVDVFRLASLDSVGQRLYAPIEGLA